MKADSIDKARDPLLPAAWVAIQRAAQRARQVAFRTRTEIVVSRGGRIERIRWDQVRETEADYRVEPPGNGEGE